MKHLVFVSDVDGTLVARGEGIDPELAHAVSKLRGAGWTAVLATGRRLHQLKNILDEVPVDAVLSSEGATVSIDGIPLRCKRLTAAEWRQIVWMGRSCGLTPLVCTEEATFAEVWNEDINYASSYAELRLRCGALDLRSAVEASMVVLVSANGYATRAAAERVARVCRVQAAVSAPGFISITPMGTNKGAALRWLVDEHLGPCEIVAAGDGLNDVALLQEADVRIAMPGAPPELLSIADVIAEPIEDGGITKAIEGLISPTKEEVNE